jgi:hypothetical protein
LNSLLNIGTQTILALGRYAQIQTQRDTIKNQAIVIPMIFKLDPQTLKPEFEIFDQNFHLPLQIPKLAINAEISQFSLAQFIHHPLLQNLRGNVAISLNAENSLSDPTINLMVRASELAYTLSQREDDNDFMVLDGIDYQLSVSIISKKIGISTRAKILNKHLMHAHALMDMHIGLDPRTFKVFHKPGQHVYANLTINEFKLEELAPYLGLTEQLYGKVQGFFEIYGDPACPNFGKQKRKGIAQNYLEISNGYFGVPRSKYAQIATQSKSSTSVPALIFDKFRLAFRTLSDGRVDIRLGMWSPQHRASKQPDMLNGVFQGPLPFQLFPLAAKEMKTQRRCLHWSGGKPSEALEVLLSTGERGLPLHFIESFVEGMRLDAYLKFAVKMGGTLSQPLIHPGGVSMQIKQILYQDYGLRIATNINNNNSLRHKCRQLVNADNSRRKMQHIEGCIYSFVNLGFNTDRYQLDVRLQGSSGAPLIITGNVPHKSFVPKSLDFSAYAEKGNFQPMWTSRYRMAMRPNLRISGDFNAPQIRGNLLIPQMLFSLPESSGRPSNFSDDPDLIVIGEKSEERLLSKEQKITIAKQPGILDKMFADISIIIPRNFRIRNREIEIEARTDEFRNMRVLLQKGILHLSGGIEVVRGELSFYTKKFAIKPGSSVTFTGQALSFEQFGQLNAQLNITASYALNVSKGTSLDKKGHKRLNILLAISGTIQQPTIDLSVQDASTEQIIAMDKASIIALILTGSTTDDLTTGQQQGLTDQALGILGKAVAAQLRNTLSDVMPLDVLKIETGAKAEDLKVELGWYLTRSIYLQLLARPLPLEEDNYWELLFDIALSRSWSLELRFGQMKRSNTPLFRGSTHLYFRMKY